MIAETPQSSHHEPPIKPVLTARCTTSVGNFFSEKRSFPETPFNKNRQFKLPLHYCQINVEISLFFLLVIPAKAGMTISLGLLTNQNKVTKLDVCNLTSVMTRSFDICKILIWTVLFRLQNIRFFQNGV
jgi:hypothetical protein